MSILLLMQVASALQASAAELLGDVTTQSSEWLLIRELLTNQDEATLRRARTALAEMLGTASRQGGAIEGVVATLDRVPRETANHHDHEGKHEHHARPG